MFSFSIFLMLFLALSSFCADMPIFGQCPAQDDFYLVMCSHCSEVVKPQAFQAHYGKCHAPRKKQMHVLYLV